MFFLDLKQKIELDGIERKKSENAHKKTIRELSEICKNNEVLVQSVKTLEMRCSEQDDKCKKILEESACEKTRFRTEMAMKENTIKQLEFSISEKRQEIEKMQSEMEENNELTNKIMSMMQAKKAKKK